MRASDPTLPRPTLLRETARLQEALLELSRVLRSWDRSRAARYDLSESQHHALQTLAARGPLAMQDFAVALHLEKSSATRLAESLLARHLVRRRAPESDGRVVVLQVTEAGHRLSRRVLNDLTGELLDALASLEPGARTALPGTLMGLARTLGTRLSR